jgi:hypothetical protein
MSLFVASSKIIASLTIITYAVFTDHVLTASKVFFAITVYNVMGQMMISFVPVAAAAVGDLIVTLNRIEAFLMLEEQQTPENPQVSSRKSFKTLNAGDLGFGNSDKLTVNPEVKFDNATAR